MRLIIGMTALVIAAILLVVLVFLGISAFTGWIFMLLWNWIAAGIFGAPVISFLQAWGLWLLITLIGGAFKAITR
jgi:hypothetical protein